MKNEKKEPKILFVFFLLCICFYNNHVFSQSISTSLGKTNIINIELRHINSSELKKMDFDLTKLENDNKESHEYYVDNQKNVFFLIRQEDQLFYYLQRNYTDIDLINKVSKTIFYILPSDNNSIDKKIVFLKVDLDNKKIIR